MGFRVCTIAADGSAAVATPVPETREAAEALAAAGGGEVLTAALVAALQRGDAPAGGGLATAEFFRRLAPVLFTLATKPDALQRKWDRLLSVLDRFAVVYPTRAPLSAMIDAAVGDGIATADQAAALRA
jgi:hypothetical protein